MKKAMYYCNCTNEDCEISQEILDLEKPCPECGGELEPAQVDEW